MQLRLDQCSAVLVDRNSFQRKLLRSLLRSTGFHRLIEVESFESGIEEAKRCFPDFLFIDYDTAKTSELMRGISSIPQQFLPGHTRLIMLMDNPTRPRVKTAIDIGSHWVLSRPFSPHTLNRRIRAVLDPGSLIKITKSNERNKKQNSQEQEPMTHLMSEMDDLLRQSQYFSPKPEKPLTQPRKAAPKPKAEQEEEDIFLL